MENTDLVIRLKQGDNRAYEKIVAQYSKPIYSFIVYHTRNKADAEDICQEVFWKVYSKIQSLRDNFRFVSWMYSIARNTMNTFFRVRNRKKEVSSEFIEDIVFDDGFSLSSEDKMDLFEAIAKLPISYSELIYWKYFERMSGQEMADLTGLTENNVKVKIHRAKSKLAEILEGQKGGKK